MRAELDGQRAVEVGPARGEPVGVDVLTAVHQRDVAGLPRALVLGAVDLGPVAAPFEVGESAEPRHERAAEIAQESQRGGKRRVELG
ncbi:MAG: hypothetical protein ACRELZ_22595 [Candidatus Rokuibacteriota bacterium]